MKGWLDKYNDGGPVQPNYNDASVSMSEDFVGDGYNTKGRNYSPAWGGQFEDGGFLQPNSYKLPKGIKVPYADSSSELAMSIGGEGGEPAYLIPSFKYGQPLKNPMAEYMLTGEHLGGPFKTWQEADKWEQDIRHPYVEKGQAIPTPIKTWGDMAMGGSMPGAVGFTYARVAGSAPSKGPYGKKTPASAQNGAEMSFYQNGLDWKPKSISKDGSKIDPSLFIGKNPKTFGKNVAVSDKGVNRVMPSDPTKLRVITQAELDAQETKERRDRINVANAVQPYMWSSPENFAVATSAIDDKLRFSDAPNWFDDNPVNLLRLSGLASGLGQVPLNIKEGNYGQAAMNIAAPIAAGAGEALLEPFVQKATNVIGKGIDYGIKNATKYNSVNEIARHTLAGIPPERSLPRLTSAELKDARIINELGNMKTTGVPSTKQIEYATKSGLSEEKLNSLFPNRSAQSSQAPTGQASFGRANPELARIRSQAITPEIEDIAMSMPNDIAERGDSQEMFDWMMSQPSRIDPEALAAVNADRPIVHDAVDYDPGDYGNMTYREWLDMNQPSYDDIYPNDIYGEPGTDANLDQLLQGIRRPEPAQLDRLTLDADGNIITESAESASARSQRIRQELDDVVASLNNPVNAREAARRGLPYPTGPIDPLEPNGPRIVGRMDPGTVERAMASRVDEPPYPEMYQPNEDAVGAAIDDAMQNIPSREVIDLTRSTPRRGRVLIPGQTSTRTKTVEDIIPPIPNIPQQIGDYLATNTFQEYPLYRGPVETNLDYLTMLDSGSKKRVAQEINKAAEKATQSGKVYTGSDNTSHNSYLTQLKKQFKMNKENPGGYNPQFLGYRQMNPMGNLTNAGYSKEQVAAFLNSEIDQQIKRGIIPKDIQRPHIRGNEVQLPQYGLKKNEYGGTLDYFEQGGQLTKLDQLTNFTNYNTKQPGSWLDKYQ